MSNLRAYLFSFAFLVSLQGGIENIGPGGAAPHPFFKENVLNTVLPQTVDPFRRWGLSIPRFLIFFAREIGKRYYEIYYQDETTWEKIKFMFFYIPFFCIPIAFISCMLNIFLGIDLLG